MSTDKVREDRFRRELYRMGYGLMKSRARDPNDLTYGGYQIIDLEINGLVAGLGNANRGFAFNLDDVEQWIEWIRKQTDRPRSGQHRVQSA